MMFKKALTKSGRRILKAIKKLSSASIAKKQQHQLQEKQKAQPQAAQGNWTQQTRLYELDNLSLASCSMPSLDLKSIDTFVTYVPDCGVYDECSCCCCYCGENEENRLNENLENEENQLNENLENEMMR